MQGRTWASTYATQLEHLGKMYTDNTLDDLSVLPTFAYLAMKSHSCDCSRGALGLQLLLSQLSTLPLPSHSADIAWLYSLQLDGHVPVLEELAAHLKKRRQKPKVSAVTAVQLQWLRELSRRCFLL
jgi:hypothetical protein